MVTVFNQFNQVLEHTYEAKINRTNFLIKPAAFSMHQIKIAIGNPTIINLVKAAFSLLALALTSPIALAGMGLNKALGRKIEILTNDQSLLAEAKLLKKDDAEFRRLDPRAVTKLYSMLEDMQEIFEQHGIRWWLTGGSLIGQVRHGGIIPWDDDIDTSLHPDDLTQLKAKEGEINQALKAKGLELIPHYYGYKIVIPNDQYPEFLKDVKFQEETEVDGKKITYNWPYVDIFPTQRKGDKITLMGNSLASWPNDIVMQHELEETNSSGEKAIPLKKFGSLYVPVPAKSENYLNRGYGPKWKYTATKIYDHVLQKWYSPSERLNLQIRDRSSAVCDHSDLYTPINHKTIATTDLTTKSEDELHRDWNFKAFFPRVIALTLGVDRDFPIDKANLDVITRSKKRIEETLKHHEKFGLKAGDIELFRGTFGRCEEELARDLAATFNLSEQDAKQMATSIHHRMDGNYKGLSENSPALISQYKAQIGCYLSHYRIIKSLSDAYNGAITKLKSLNKDLKQCQNEDVKQQIREEIARYKEIAQKNSVAMVIEDDNRFGRVTNILKGHPKLGTEIKEDHNGVKLGKVFRQAIQQLPEDWDMFYFLSMGAFEMPTEQAPNLKRLIGGQSLAAFAIRARAYDKILRALEKLILPEWLKVRPVDGEIAALHPSMKAFVIHPSFAYQNNDDSTIVIEEQPGVACKVYYQVQQSDINKPWQ